MSQTRSLPSAVMVATMGMELAYLYLGLVLVREHLGLSYAAFTLIMLLYLLSPLIELIAAGFPDAARRIQLLAVPLSIVLSLAVVAPAIWQTVTAGYPEAGPLAALGFCALAWWLGATLVRFDTGYYHLLFRFQIGVLFLIVFAGAGRLLPVVVFYVLALFALARARWGEAVARSRGVLQTYSFFRVILGAAAVFVPAALIMLIVSPQIAGNILRWLTGGYESFMTWFTAVMSADFWTKPLVDINWQPSCAPDTPIEDKPPPMPTPRGETIAIPPIVAGIALFAVCLAGFTFITLAIIKIRSRRRAHRTNMVRFEASSKRVNVFRELAALLRGVLGWLWRRLLSALKLTGVGRFRPTPDAAATSVRVIYRDLLRWAEARAAPREPSHTATEYLGVLCRKFPREAGALALITDIYVRARYGRSTTSGEDFLTAREAWQRVRSRS